MIDSDKVFMRVTIEFIEANKPIIEQFEYFLLLISIYYFSKYCTKAYFGSSCMVCVCETIRDNRIKSTVMKVCSI